MKCIVFHGEIPGGQLTQTTEIENFPGFKGTGSELVDKIADQATEAGAKFSYEKVVDCDLSESLKKIKAESDDIFTCKALIIATGASAQYLGLPNEDRLKSKGVSGCATCDGPLFRGKDVVVVGGGDAAVEEAIFLSHLCKSVKLIHRRDQLRASLPMKKKIEESKVEVIWWSVIVDVLGENYVTGIKVKNVQTEKITEIACDGLFVAIGHKPATEVFRKSLECDGQGYFITDGSPATKIPGVYVAGDCADRIFRQAVTSAATGCQAALLAERYLLQ